MSHKLVGFSNSINSSYIQSQLVSIANEISDLETEFADENDDRKITNGEMQEYLTTEIPIIALSLHNREQDPFFKGDKDLILTSF